MLRLEMFHEQSIEIVPCQDRQQGREEVQADNHAGTASEDASWPWKIFTKKGIAILVDEEDYRVHAKYRWFLDSGGYAAMNIYPIDDNGNKVHKIVTMHRLIIDPPDGFQVDHRDRNRLNNRRSNLRVATHAQNMLNKSKYKSNTSGITGVKWHKREQKWWSEICFQGKNRWLGYFSSKEEASKAYQQAHKKYFGEFASIQ
jgi:hypothetical protein